MSVESGNSVYEYAVKEKRFERRIDPTTAVGEFFYSPDTWKQGFGLIATAGRILSTAVGGTSRIASMTLGAPNMQPTPNPAIGGKV